MEITTFIIRMLFLFFLESAVTTIQDIEDSVSVVDAVDKTHAYGNWLKLIPEGFLDGAVTTLSDLHDMKMLSV